MFLSSPSSSCFRPSSYFAFVALLYTTVVDCEARKDERKTKNRHSKSAVFITNLSSYNSLHVIFDPHSHEEHHGCQPDNFGGELIPMITSSLTKEEESIEELIGTFQKNYIDEVKVELIPNSSPMAALTCSQVIQRN